MSARDDPRYCPRCAGALAWRPAGDARVEHPTCEQCGFVLWQNPKPTVEALITRARPSGPGRDGATEVLLGRRGDGRWDAPGNFLNDGDEIEAALIRECRREMDVEVRVGEIVGAFEDESLGSQIIVLVYRCTIVSGEPRAADIVEDVGWFALDALPAIAYRSIERALGVLRRQARRI